MKWDVESPGLWMGYDEGILTGYEALTVELVSGERTPPRIL